MLKDPSTLNFWGRLQQKQMAGLMKPYQEQQGRERIRSLMGMKAQEYEMDDEELFPGEAPIEGLKTKGTGYLGGEMGNKELFAEMLTTPGYQNFGMQGLMSSGGSVKPTSLMQNIAAGGLKQGTPEYQKFMLDKLQQASTQINMGGKYITSADAQQMRNDKQQMPPIGMTWADAEKSGFRFVNKQEIEKAGSEKEVIGSMQQSLDVYKDLLKKQGSMNVVDMFTDATDYAKLDAAYGQLQLEYKELAKLGVLTGPDMGLIERVMVDPTGIKANAIQYFSGKDSLYNQLDIVGEKLTAARKRAEARYGKNWRNVSKNKTVKFGDLP